MKGRKHKAAGGKTADGMKASYGGGDPPVVAEAEEKKKGGKVGGKKGKHRMDRASGGVVRAAGGGVPGRKRGGRVGADSSPLTSAHNTSSPAKAPKEEEGGLST